MSQKYLLSMILCLPMGCAPQGKIDSINRALALFVPHPWCTIGRTWDPDIDKPSCSARKQLSPSGTKLRIGMPTQNKAYAIRVGSVVYGPGVDISCRLGAKLHLPIEFHTYATQDTWVTGFRAGEFDIGFAHDPALAPSDMALANPYIGVENTYIVPNGSSFQVVADVPDAPGVRIGVTTASAPDLYLTTHLHFATLVRYPVFGKALAALTAGQVIAVAAGRGGPVTIPGPYHALADNLFVANLAPLMHLNNQAGVCYLTDYIEAAKESGLTTEAIRRITSSPFPFIPGFVNLGSMPTCENDDQDQCDDDNGDDNDVENHYDDTDDTGGGE